MTIRIMAGLLAVVLMLLQYRIWASPDGMREVWRLEQAIDVAVGRKHPARNPQPHARGRSPRPQGRPQGHRGTRAHRPRHGQDERDLLPGRAAGATRFGDRCRHPPLRRRGKGRPRPTCRDPRGPALGDRARGGAGFPLRRRAPQAIHAAARTARCCPGRWPRCSPNPASTASWSRSRRAMPTGRACPSFRVRASAAARAATRREHSVANGLDALDGEAAGHGLGAGPRCRASLPAPPRPRLCSSTRSTRMPSAACSRFPSATR